MINENAPELEQHQQEQRQAQRLVMQCPKCGMLPAIQYEPGCAFAKCQCHKWAIPEDDRMKLARIINRTLEPRLKARHE